MLQKIGSGAYGVIYRRVDATGINIIKRNLVDHTVSFMGSLRELDVAVRLRGHPNIVLMTSIVDNMQPLSREDVADDQELLSFKDDTIHFMMENAEYDLYTLIETGLNPNHVKHIMADILLGCEYMHMYGYLHRDIKPSNILIFPYQDHKRAKLCDFGLSKPILPNGCMTPKIVTMWYRAPEICYQNAVYHPSSDVWSIGCVFYEMLRKKPLCDNITSQSHLLKFIHTQDRTKDQFMSELQCNASERDMIYDVLMGLLEIDANKRLTIQAALQLPYFDAIRDDINYVINKYHTNISYELYVIVDVPEREYLIAAINLIYESRQSFSWYTHRILFMGISLMDRYLAWKQGTSQSTNSNSGIILRFLICLYIALKYHTTLARIPPFQEFVADEYQSGDFVKFGETFERFMVISVMNCKLYQPTVYECACRQMGQELGGEYIKRLILGYTHTRKFEGTAEALLIELMNDRE